MALIEAKGYVNKPATRGNDKKFATFTLAERQLGKDKQPHKVFYDVVDFSSEKPPAESSFVTVKGYLNISKTEKDGKTYTNLSITAKSIDIAPPRGDDGGNKEATPGNAEDEFSF